MLDRLKTWLGSPDGAARILLAEDDPAMRDLLATTLRREGYAVAPFQDGRELLAHVEALRVAGEAAQPDLIISDVRMPGLDGIGMLAAIRGADLDVPVILITAFGDPDAHDQAFDLGAVMLDKPFPMEALCATVRCLVR
jgi:DNA-binding response OmpR family regulator